MKKWLILITLIFGLSACSSSDNKVEIKQEKLYSFLIVQDKLYAVGEHHDYQFEHDLVEKLDSFLKSPYEKFISEIEINLDVKLGVVRLKVLTVFMLICLNRQNHNNKN